MLQSSELPTPLIEREGIFSKPPATDCRKINVPKTSFVPDILEQFTQCRDEVGKLENTLDDIYTSVRYKKSFGDDAAKRQLEKVFASEDGRGSRQLNYVLSELNFGIKMMNDDYGLNWNREPNEATGGEQLRIDLLDNSKESRVLDTVLINLPKK